MKRLALALLLLLAPSVASASGVTYTGSLVVPVGSSVTMQGNGSGCVLTNSSGQQYVAVCPNGTAAFTGTLPITITGTGPYAINCPTCAVTSFTSQTFLGPTTFNSATTFGALITANGGINVAGGPLDLGTSGVGSAGDLALKRNASTAFLYFINSSNFLDFGSSNTSAYTFTGGNVFAPAFLTTSLRAHKSDIKNLNIDALGILRSADWASFHYLPKYGDPKEEHIGFIADDTPSILSGPDHNHFDLQAVATVDAQAIIQLDGRLEVLAVITVLLAIATAGLLIHALLRD